MNRDAANNIHLQPLFDGRVERAMRLFCFLDSLWSADCATPPARPGRSNLQSSLSALSPPLSASVSLPLSLWPPAVFFVKQPAVPLLFNMRGETARHALVSRARETSCEHGEKELGGGNKKHTVHHNCVGVTENLPGKNLTVEPEQSRNNGGVMRSGHSLDEE